jgi:hypothetical protein
MQEVGSFAGLKKRKRVNFTAVAWQRLFEEYVSFSPMEMDYKAFVNLVLALEHSATPEGMEYFWRVLDFDKSGRLTATKIKYFYSAIYDSLTSSYECPSAAHVVTEVFDLLACNSSEGATFQDLLASKQGHIVASMLLDVNGFWRYDNRESLAGSGDGEEDEEDEEEDQQAGAGSVANVGWEVLEENEGRGGAAAAGADGAGVAANTVAYNEDSFEKYNDDFDDEDA